MVRKRKGPHAVAGEEGLVIQRQASESMLRVGS